jgi:hypothetical protein
MLDIKGAFDHATHRSITTALRDKSCPTHLVDIITSYLSDRSAVFLINQTVNEANISRGCPQGSVLSPFLWNVLADDVFSIALPPGVEIRGFADDLSIACSSGSVTSISNCLQNACNAIIEWGAARCLTFSDQKSEAILFSRKRSADSTLNVSINNTPIRTLEQVKCLGVILDRKLSWHPHIDAKCLAAKRAIQFLRSFANKTWGRATTS